MKTRMGNTPLPRILIVEDNQDVADTTAEVLELFGFETASVPNAQAALRRLKQHRPDALLLDLGLPGMDGFELTERIRRVDPTLPVIAYTGYGRREDIQRGVDVGINVHLIKPSDPFTIDGTIRAALERSR